jgi:hypothetical protein
LGCQIEAISSSASYTNFSYLEQEAVEGAPWKSCSSLFEKRLALSSWFWLDPEDSGEWLMGEDFWVETSLLKREFEFCCFSLMAWRGELP